jgi:hypothetical protein
MEPDYPAAHSMDTTWFGVDDKGRVGIFFSGEDGPVPSGSYDQGSIITVVATLSGRTADEDEEDDPDFEALEDEAADLGLFVYQYVASFEEFVRPYSFTRMPEVPRHIEQLPPELRKLFATNHLSGVEFPTSDNIQIAEHLPPAEVFYYYEDSVAYLCADEKTVRPIPGKEDRFPAFCRELRRDPEAAARFILDGPQDPE